MSEVVLPVSSSSVSKTMTLSTSYEELFSYGIENGRVFVSMVENGFNIGGISFLVGGGIAKSVGFTGGMYFSESLDVSLLPVSYGASSNDKNYTVFFNYENGTFRVCKNESDPELTITFNGTFDSATEQFANSVHAVDTIVENSSGSGTTFENKVIFNGGVETSNLPTGSITFSDENENITFSNISSKASNLGQMCNIVVQATMAVSGALLTKGSEYSFFSVTPTNTYKSSYRCLGKLLDDNTKDTSVIFNDPNTADFNIVLPRNMGSGSSTTLVATITYFAS